MRHRASVDFDLAIVGAGFGGALLALVARRLGKRVLLVERDRHPRFSIGESSTPLANLWLEQLAHRYDLPRIHPLTKWGTWQRTYPEIGCGIKRGFTFYHHQAGQAWTPDPRHRHELLVAASPHADIADTHWYRPDFDAFLVAEAIAAGVEYWDQTELAPPHGEIGRVELEGQRLGRTVAGSVGFLVDASGPRGFLHRTLELPVSSWPELPATRAVFSHFSGVERWDALHPSEGIPPYPPDDAAMHHVTSGGWMWVLRFRSGITSAGFTTRRPHQSGVTPEQEWAEWMQEFPAVAEQFRDAQPIRPVRGLQQLAFRTGQAVGPWWVQLPAAAGFVDPLLSTGIPLNLLGIIRVARLLEEDWSAAAITKYGIDTLADLDVTAALVGALYRVMDDFPTFRQLTMAYFAAASFSETAQRLGHPERAPGFLLRSLPAFTAGFHRILPMAGRIPGAQLQQEIALWLEPYNLVGLGQAAKQHWYGCDAKDLFAAADRIGASRAEIGTMLARCGFSA
jgi:FADH2 O2-dependent halogenase